MTHSLPVNQITHLTIGAGMRVHRKVGPGLLESACQLCFAWELKQGGLRFVTQHPIPRVYGNFRLARCYRLDFLVEEAVVVEVKAVDRLVPVGLVLNFCAPVLKEGIMRVANGAPDLGAEADEFEDTEKRF